MLLSLALIFIIGMSMGALCRKLRLPPLLGMIFTGIILGPCVLDLIDGSLLGISAELRKIALIIILTRAGLSLNIADLKKAGRPAVLMCFLPACFEMLGMIILAPRFLGISTLEAALLGAVVGAVSPAVIVPKMLKLMEENYGTEKSIPQMILAAASVDDAFVIVVFSVILGLMQTGSFSPAAFARTPVSILTGIVAGVAVGFVLAKLFGKFHIRDSVKVLIFLSAAFLLSAAEDKFSEIVPFSYIIAVMTGGIVFNRFRPEAAARVSAKFSKLWICAEVLLFVLVGAAVDISCAFTAGAAMLALIPCVLLFRMAGVALCLVKTKLTAKERLFCM
ncbi:MAG: cation:proton antiporter, partial [Huintestinicola sp.]